MHQHARRGHSHAGDPDIVAEAQAETETAPERKKLSNLVLLIKDDAKSAVALNDCRVKARQTSSFAWNRPAKGPGSSSRAAH